MLKKSGKNSQKMKNKWFDKSCFELKREVQGFGKLTSKSPSDPLCKVNFFVIFQERLRKLVKNEEKNFVFKNSYFKKLLLLSLTIPRISGKW